MITKIFLDIDDVLTNLVADCMIHMGLPNYSRQDYPIDFRDITVAYHQLTGIKYDNNFFWRHFERQFWATLTPASWCFDLIDLCLKFVDRADLFLLSAPTEYGDSLSGKHDWIIEKMPKFLHTQYLIGSPKFACACPGAVLIDDLNNNVEDFRKAGGFGITFPQPWNTHRSYIGKELKYVESSLHYYKDVKND